MSDHPSSRYSDDERIAIERWLLDGFSASRIAQEFIRKFQRYVSRNAIIGVIHRDPALMKIGLAGKGRTVAGTEKDGRRHNTHRVRAVAAGRAAPKGRVPKPEASPVASRQSKPAPAPSPKPFVNFAAYDAGSRRLPLVDLDRHDCRFAVNDAAPGEEHLFCGQPVAPDSPYCPHHSTRAFNGFVSEGMRRGDIFRQRRIA